MRLTSEVVQHATQQLNCIGDRELVLRGMGIPVIENLAIARDGFDTIDLSANIITVLGDGFPPFPRLKTLYLGLNRISKVTSGLADSLPNLETLILESNRIESIEDLNLSELSKLKRLEVLSIRNNPLAGFPSIRSKILRALPWIKIIDFENVSQTEKQGIQLNGDSESKKRGAKRKSDTQKTQEGRKRRKRSNGKLPVENVGEDPTSGKRGRKGVANDKTSLTGVEEAAVRSLIENAKTVDEVTAIQAAIQKGAIRDLLRKSGDPTAR